MSLNDVLRMVAAGILALGTSSAALADESSNDDWWPGWGMGRMMHWGMPDAGPDAMLDRVDGRLAFLKAELKITGAQESAWADLASAVRATAETHNAMMREMMGSMRSGEFWKKPLPERLSIQESHLAARLDQVKTIKTAVGGLYDVLTPEQRAVADEIVLPTIGMGPGRGMGRRMMMGN
jgi:hypothetical protein